jgi:hypothetical protein
VGLFRKRAELPSTPEERAGQRTRRELLRHWGTIPDGMKLDALSMATEDQLRVLGWDLPNPHDRFLAITEARQRRERPDLYRRIQDAGELSPEQFEEWTAPLREMHGWRVTARLADQAYEEVFAPQRSLDEPSKVAAGRVIGSPDTAWYRPLPDETCAMCGSRERPLTMSVIRYVQDDRSPLPEGFVPQSASFGTLHGVFLLCSSCSPPCARCGMPTVPTAVQAYFEDLNHRLDSPNSPLSWGAETCWGHGLFGRKRRPARTGPRAAGSSAPLSALAKSSTEDSTPQIAHDPLFGDTPIDEIRAVIHVKALVAGRRPLVHEHRLEVAQVDTGAVELTELHYRAHGISDHPPINKQAMPWAIVSLPHAAHGVEVVQDDGNSVRAGRDVADRKTDALPTSKREMDPGLQVVHDVFDQLQIDDDWSIWEERGFTWWRPRARASASASSPRRGIDADGSSVAIACVGHRLCARGWACGGRRAGTARASGERPATSSRWRVTVTGALEDIIERPPRELRCWKHPNLLLSQDQGEIWRPERRPARRGTAPRR